MLVVRIADGAQDLVKHMPGLVFREGALVLRSPHVFKIVVAIQITVAVVVINIGRSGGCFGGRGSTSIKQPSSAQ